MNTDTPAVTDRLGEEPVGWFDLDDADWYNLDEDTAAALCSQADKAFLGALRQRAQAADWSCDPDDTQARHMREQGRTALWVLLTLADEELSQHLLTFGVVFDGSQIVADEVEGQTYAFLGRTPAHLEVSGSPVDLADAAAGWFGALLDWPIERREWGTLELPFYQEWVLLPSAHPNGSSTYHLDEWCLSATRGSRPTGTPDKISHVRGRRAIENSRQPEPENAKARG